MKIEDLKFDIPFSPVDEENWDIERWRRENPMDYLKALYLVMSFPEKFPTFPRETVMQIAFESVYRVTRHYVPDVLYKYYSLTKDKGLNKMKLNTLEKNQIFMSNIKDFNDPFDGKAFFYNPEGLKDIERLSEHNGKLIDDFTVFLKGTAFTQNDMNCMPMWAHYANNHQGYCVAYDMKNQENLELAACTFPIQYTEQRLDVTSFMKNYANNIVKEINTQIAIGRKEIMIKDLSIIYMAQYLCNIKHLSWQYEHEFRCSMGAIAKGMPYVNAVPKEIYIGIKCNEKNRKKLIKIARQKKIPVYQMNYKDVTEDYVLEAEVIQD